MTRSEFLSALTERLSGAPEEDIARYREFYGESIDDRIEEGFSEEEAVAALGSMDEIVSSALGEIPLSKLLKERIKPKRELRGWQIALIVIGSPLWIAALAVVFSLLVTLFVVLWALVVVVYAVTLSLCLCAPAALVAGAAVIATGNMPTAVFLIGAGICLVGLGILAVYASVYATKGAVILCRKIILGIKAIFVRKEKEA